MLIFAFIGNLDVCDCGFVCLFCFGGLICCFVADFLVLVLGSLLLCVCCGWIAGRFVCVWFIAWHLLVVSVYTFDLGWLGVCCLMVFVCRWMVAGWFGGLV